MVNQDILEGLKNALAKGHSLEHAMTSFHNAGYSNQEIEEAARQLHKPTHEVQKQPAPKEKPKPVAKPVEKHVEEKPAEVKPEEKKLTKQEVSKYEEKTKPKGKLWLIILIVAFVIVALGLVASLILSHVFP